MPPLFLSLSSNYPAQHKVDAWQGCSGPITHNPVPPLPPSMAPCSCGSCRVSRLGVINDIRCLILNGSSEGGGHSASRSEQLWRLAGSRVCSYVAWSQRIREGDQGVEEIVKRTNLTKNQLVDNDDRVDDDKRY